MADSWQDNRGAQPVYQHQGQDMQWQQAPAPYGAYGVHPEQPPYNGDQAQNPVDASAHGAHGAHGARGAIPVQYAGPHAAHGQQPEPCEAQPAWASAGTGHNGGTTAGHTNVRAVPYSI